MFTLNFSLTSFSENVEVAEFLVWSSFFFRIGSVTLVGKPFVGGCASWAILLLFVRDNVPPLMLNMVYTLVLLYIQCIVFQLQFVTIIQ